MFGCFLGRVPTVNERRRIDTLLFRGERAFPLVKRPDAGFINCKRTQSYLAVGLDAATGGAAFRIDADLAAGWSDVSRRRQVLVCTVGTRATFL